MSEQKGTPQSLVEAIRFGISCGPIMEIDLAVCLCIRDFLSQKFGAAMLLAKTPEEQTALQELWFQITGETLK